MAEIIYRGRARGRPKDRPPSVEKSIVPVETGGHGDAPKSVKEETAVRQIRTGRGRGVPKSKPPEIEPNIETEKIIQKNNSTALRLESIETPVVQIPVIGRARGRSRNLIDTCEIFSCRKPPEELLNISCALALEKPKQGFSGTKIELSANYFAILTHPNWALYQYRVDFLPDEERTLAKKQMLRDHKSKFGGGYLFDGTALFVTQRLNPEPMVLSSTRDIDGTPIKLIIKKAAELKVGDNHYIQLFNILMRKCLENMQLQLVGRNYFDATSKIDVNEYKLELWPGYITSIRQHENNILMCAEVTHKVMRKDTAWDLYDECVKSQGNEWQTFFTSAILGTVILTGYNNRTYRIDKIDFETNPDSTFELKNSEYCSFVDYYKQRYGLNIRDRRQPMLVSKAKPRDIRAGVPSSIYLVPELCRLTGLTDQMRSKFHLMRALADHTRVTPKSRIEKLLNLSARLKKSKTVQEDLSLWNMKLSSGLVKFQGRVLPEESICYGDKQTVNTGTEADWTRTLRQCTMLSMGELKIWAIIYLRSSKTDVLSFLNALTKSSHGLSFSIPPPLNAELPDDKSSTYISAIEELISRKNPQLIMCIVPNNRAERYSAIKKKCCLDRPVPTQVVVSKNLTAKSVMSIAAKIAIQMNCKIGGTPWTVNVPLNGLMVIGYDVCHDTLNKKKSFGAMVASINRNFSKYYSAATAHSTGEELSNDLACHILNALSRYNQFNSAYPSCIILYRDGVGEGQIPYVHAHEVVNIKEKINKVYNGQPPRMAFVVVTKRLNTRIFHNNENPPPGTVVDDCITTPDKFDFFLVSQSVRQGTVSPTSYNVIDDSSRLDPDKLQRLTYKMTHLYYNWSGTVRVPAQCQYAHKLAFLVGQTLHQSPCGGLQDLLYFL